MRKISIWTPLITMVLLGIVAEVSADASRPIPLGTAIAIAPNLVTTGDGVNRRQNASASVLLGVTPIPDNKPEAKSKNVIITDPVDITDVKTLGTDEVKEEHDLPESGTLDDSTVIQAPDINEGP